MPTPPKWIYRFGKHNDGDGGMRALLGGKGAGLTAMSALGLPVPPGFIITTEACKHYHANNKTMPPGFDIALTDALKALEAETGRSPGNTESPLLLAVRSAARVSMPGMMDSVLNVGLNDAVMRALADASGDARFAWDTMRRFIANYGAVVCGIDHDLFEDALEDMIDTAGAEDSSHLGADDLQKLTGTSRAIVQDETGANIPDDPATQLTAAIAGVFNSWMNDRAATYRKLNNIPDDWGMAVVVQAMVFGNMGDDSATGVAFTRDPATGANRLYGEYLPCAQGEDVVAGIRTPLPLTREGAGGVPGIALEDTMPGAFAALCDMRARLEKHATDMQDIEFTIERGRLYLLQTRSGKRTAIAAVRIATDMAEENLITRGEAIMRVDAAALEQLLHPVLDTKAAPPESALTRGLPASPGVAIGAVALTAGEAVRMAAAGEAVILVRGETSPDDIHGMHAAGGVLTARGGMTSHAAVVARGMGRPCICGANTLRIDEDAGVVYIGEAALQSGDVITIDGGSGDVFAGAMPVIAPPLSGAFAVLIAWADEIIAKHGDTIADATPPATRLLKAQEILTRKN